MQIKEVTLANIENYEAEQIKPSFIAKHSKNKEIKLNKSSTPSLAWQKDILMNAIEMLENNIQMDNTHPLSQPMNAPIETFHEALIELSFIKTPKFREEALAAQANVNVENILTLFTAQ